MVRLEYLVGFVEPSKHATIMIETKKVYHRPLGE